MNYSEMTITPELAEKWLENNSINRRINRGRVKQYAYDMMTGKWQLNGEAIKVYTDGSLADGQHRLAAIIETGKPVKMCVITDVPKGVTVQDRGRTRSTIDSMILEGYPKDLANKDNVAVAKLHYAVSINGNHNNVSDGMVRDFLLRNEEKILSVQSVTRSHGKLEKGRINISAPVKLAMFYALNSQACTTSDLKDFVDVLRTGIPTKLCQSAAIVCRNDIISGAIAARGATQERIIAVFQVEKALSDFLNEYQRKITYGRWTTPIYSCLEVNKEA